jgi:hypothetical protein
MAELGEYHKRRILVTFQHIDKLLSQSLQAMARSDSDLQAHYVQDLSSSKLLHIQNHIERIRDLMIGFLKRFDIALPERSKPSSWILKTNLTSAGIALDDLSPSKMKGYGDMESAATRDLTQTIQEIRKAVNQLLKSLE